MAVVREAPGIFLASHCLAPDLLSNLLQVVCPRLADERISPNGGGGGGSSHNDSSTSTISPGLGSPAGLQEVAQQVHRAMNKLAIAGESVKG